MEKKKNKNESDDQNLIREDPGRKTISFWTSSGEDQRLALAVAHNHPNTPISLKPFLIQSPVYLPWRLLIVFSLAAMGIIVVFGITEFKDLGHDRY